jgi:hypothetical protein
MEIFKMKKEISQELKNLWDQMHNLTNSKCREICNPGARWSCCHLSGCQMTRSYNLDVHGIDLGEGEYRGEDGCTISSWYRPGCVAYICDKAFSDLRFYKKYWALYDQILLEVDIDIEG